MELQQHGEQQYDGQRAERDLVPPWAFQEEDRAASAPPPKRPRLDSDGDGHLPHHSHLDFSPSRAENDTGSNGYCNGRTRAFAASMPPSPPGPLGPPPAFLSTPTSSSSIGGAVAESFGSRRVSPVDPALDLGPPRPPSLGPSSAGPFEFPFFHAGTAPSTAIIPPPQPTSPPLRSPSPPPIVVPTLPPASPLQPPPPPATEATPAHAAIAVPTLSTVLGEMERLAMFATQLAAMHVATEGVDAVPRSWSYDIARINACLSQLLGVLSGMRPDAGMEELLRMHAAFTAAANANAVHNGDLRQQQQQYQQSEEQQQHQAQHSSPALATVNGHIVTARPLHPDARSAESPEAPSPTRDAFGTARDQTRWPSRTQSESDADVPMTAAAGPAEVPTLHPPSPVPPSLSVLADPGFSFSPFVATRIVQALANQAAGAQAAPPHSFRGGALPVTQGPSAATALTPAPAHTFAPTGGGGAMTPSAAAAAAAAATMAFLGHLYAPPPHNTPAVAATHPLSSGSSPQVMGVSRNGGSQLPPPPAGPHGSGEGHDTDIDDDNSPDTDAVVAEQKVEMRRSIERTRLTPAQLEALRARFTISRHIRKSERIELAAQCGVPERKIFKWFANQRYAQRQQAPRAEDQPAVAAADAQGDGGGGLGNLNHDPAQDDELDASGGDDGVTHGHVAA
ncbi:hypothetical protein BC828DRAFT_371691 [Blastocladiella britannica]|nr:hypothetical protein BC828DRAFT_371691 [Blastocladiella britannica]